MSRHLSTDWPILDFATMQETVETVHQWLQIIGKTRLKAMPWLNHSWHCTLFISPAGYTTNAICFEGGTFDLAVTRFSCRPAPLHQGGVPNMPLDVMQEAYSHEVSSAGFWPGSKDSPIPVYYAYAYPGNEAYAKQKVLPEQAFYSPEMGEFILKYKDVQSFSNPEKTLMDFLQTTYEAAANTSNWDREALER